MPSDPLTMLNPTPGKCRNPDCTVVVKHPRQYCDAHKPDPLTTHKKRKKAQVAANLATPIKIPGDIAAAGQGRAGAGSPTEPKKAPTVDATARVLGRIWMYVTILVAMRLVQGDPELPTETARQAKADELALDQDQAVAMIHPLARFITPMGFWRSYGGQLIANADVIDCIAAMYDYLSGVARYSSERRRRRQELAALPARSYPSQPVAPTPPAASLSTPSMNGETPDAILGQGVVVSRSMLRRGDIT